MALLIIGMVVLMVILIGAWPTRSFIRNSGVSFYVNTAYKPFFEHRFNTAFTPINSALKQMDAYASIDPHLNAANSCDVVEYSGIHETALCQRYQVTNGIIPASSFVRDWKFGAPDLENYLLAHGWQKRDAQSISSLFDDPREARWINYSKGNDAASCHLYLHYEGRPKPTTAKSGDNKFYVDESCQRWIKFFGGY